MAYKSGPEWSGNRGGRPKKTQEQLDFERKCREWSSTFALDRLKYAADSDKPMEVIAAVKEINDRGFGKSEQVQYSEVNVTTETGSSVEELSGELASFIPAATGAVGANGSQAQVDPGK